MQEEDKLRAPNIETPWIILGAIGLFFTAVIGSIPLSVKVHSFDFLGGILIPTGTILFSLSYLATDIICELDGKKAAVRIVLIGIVMRAFLAFVTLFSLYGEDMAGISNAVFWSPENDNAFDFVIASSQMIIFGGIIAFAISSYVDVSIYSFFKRKHGSKNLLWLRNNLSTIVAQMVGTTIFVLIAFYGRLPLDAYFSIIAGQIAFKALFAVVDTPLLYMARNVGSGRRLFDLRG